MKNLLPILSTIIVAILLLSSRPSEKGTFEKPDLESIKKEVSDPKSPYYYPELMRRYERNETIMGLDDYRHLYLGMLFQEDYNPYRHSEYRDKIQELYYRENHTRPELDSIIAYAELSLEDDPFDLEQMNYLIYALRGRGKHNRANLWQYRLNHILQSIISTGSGLDMDNAWFVINPRHEYNIINFQNRTVESQQFVEPYFEYMKLTPLDSGATGMSKSVEGYYFNIKNLLEEYYKKYPEQL